MEMKAELRHRANSNPSPESRIATASKRGSLGAELNQSSNVRQLKAVGRQLNETGLPDHLKSGIESLSGMSLDGVKVHYNSPKPAQFRALAFAQGTDIHVGPGHERHLPHEAWHVVQQAQGRVRPTLQLQQGVPVNDEHHLEQEADRMGERAVAAGKVSASSFEPLAQLKPPAGSQIVQGLFEWLWRCLGLGVDGDAAQNGAPVPQNVVPQNVVAPQIAPQNVAPQNAIAPQNIAPQNVVAPQNVQAQAPAVQAPDEAPLHPGFIAANLQYASGNAQGVGSLYFNGNNGNASGRLRLNHDHGPEFSPVKAGRTLTRYNYAGNTARAARRSKRAERALNQQRKDDVITSDQYLAQIQPHLQPAQIGNPGKLFELNTKTATGEYRGNHPSRNPVIAAPQMTQAKVNRLVTLVRQAEAAVAQAPVGAAKTAAIQQWNQAVMAAYNAP